MRTTTLLAAAALAAGVAIAPLPASWAAAEDGALPYEVWNLDQLRIDSKTDPKAVAALEPAHSIDAAIAVLKAKGIRYLRTRAVLLPDRLPADMRTQIAALPEGEPFVLPEGSFISISVIVGRKLPPGAVRWMPGVRARVTGRA